MLKFALLGIIQGLTEFLPVSSSGHLVIMQKLLGISGDEVAISLILHLGTLFATCFFFFQEILGIFRDRKFLILVLIVTAVTGTIGLLAKDFFESLFSSPEFVAVSLLFTGMVLLLTRKFTAPSRKVLNTEDALYLGLAQGFAIIPGVSRSGMTISSLLFRGIDRETAFKFSFVVSIPAVLGASLLKAKDINFTFQMDTRNLIVGFCSSLLVGIFSLWFMKYMVKQAKLHYFGYYCIAISIVTLLFLK